MEDVKEKFCEAYFMRGPETGLSNYVNYRYIPELTLPMAQHLIRFFGCSRGDTLLDFGCARGYLVRALRLKGISAYGVDVSEWAVANCDPTVRDLIGHELRGPYDFTFCKDVLEHIPGLELHKVLPRLLSLTERAALFIVPLAKDGRYVYPADDADATHIHRMPLAAWLDLVGTYAADFAVFGSTTFSELKPAARAYPGSTGFIFCRRL